MTNENLLEVRDVSKRFGGVQAVGGVSLDVKPNEIVGIIGPNGAGKTTFFNLLSGLFISDTGSITFDGRDITKADLATRARMGIGRTFQVVRPFAGMTVAENVMVPLLVNNSNVRECKTRALEPVSYTHLTLPTSDLV